MAVYEATGASIPTDATSFATAEGALSNGVGGAGLVLGYVGDIDRIANTVTIYDVQDRDTRVLTSRASNSELVIKFKLITGMGPDWNDADAYITKPIVDTTVLEDYDYSTDGKCDDIRSAINVLYDIHDDILTASSATVTLSLIHI